MLLPQISRKNGTPEFKMCLLFLPNCTDVGNHVLSCQKGVLVIHCHLPLVIGKIHSRLFFL